MKKRKLLVLGAVATLALALLTACGSSSDSSASSSTTPDTTYAGQGIAVEGDTIYVGIFQPTTGENGGGGYQEVLGTRYAHELYPTVTIDGTEYNIELVEVDNQSDKAAAVTAAQNLISSKVVAVTGSYGSGVSIAAGQTFADACVPAVACSATNPQVTLGNDFYYRVCFLDPFQGTVAANYCMTEGYETAAVIQQNGDDYSTGLASYFKDAYAALGGEVVSDQTFQTNESDFKAILTSIKETNPDVIYCPSSIVTACLIIQQARALGIEAVIMAGDTWENETIITTTGADSEGVVLTTFFDENDTENPVAGEFVKGFKDYINSSKDNLTHNGGSDGVAAVSALAYDSYMAVYYALESLDGQGLETITSGDIRDALVGVSFDGVTGAISFDENGDANKTVAYIKTVEDGAFKFLRTQDAQE